MRQEPAFNAYHVAGPCILTQTMTSIITLLSETKEYQEAFNFAQQVGAFEIYQTNDAHHGKILRQMVLEAPIHWCPFVQSTPINLVGNYNW